MRRRITALSGQAWALLSLTTLLWAGNAVAGRAIAGEMAPMALIFLRWLIVCGILAFALRGEPAWSWTALKPHWRRAAWMGTIGFTLFNMLFYIAAYHTSAVNMTLLQTSIPIYVLAGAALFQGAPIRALQVCGMAATMAGVALVATRGEVTHVLALRVNFGDILLLLAGLAYAVYTLALRQRPALPPLVFFAAMAVAAFAASAPLFAAEIMAGQAYWPSLKGWLILVYIALGPSLLSQICYMRGVALIGPSRAGLFTNLVPIFGAVLAVGLLHEKFELYHSAALILGVGGIWLSERSPRPS